MTPGANDLCVFAVKRGIIGKRLDTHANHPKFRDVFIKLQEKYNVIALENAAERIFSGITPKAKGDAYSTDETGILFIKSGALSYDGSLNVDKNSRIKPEIHQGLMKSSQLKKDDILVAIVGATIGKVALFCFDYEANINQAIAAIRLKGKGLNARFVVYYLLSDIGQTYLEYLKRPVARANINLQEIGSIQIPLLPMEDQNKIVERQDAILKSCEEKRRLANELLLHTTEYVLERLGLKIYRKANPVCYAINIKEMNERFDADYYLPRFLQFRKQIEGSAFPAAFIGDICERIATGFAAGKQDQADDLPDDQRVAQLRPFSITPEGELSFDTQKYVPKERLKPEDYCQKGEVIFNNTNSPDLVGKTTVFDQDVLCATSNHMTRITVKDGVNPYYVAAFFNVLLSIGYWKLLCTNFNNQAGVNIETLKKVRIPLPDINVQNEIATEIMRRRGQANQLRKEAAKEWAAAKEQFERELLGES